jgi:Fe-S-cluster-containing hydrogenase component 2
MVNIEHEKCTGCGKCVNDCVADNLILKDGKSVCSGLCILCGHCVAICPFGAMTIPGSPLAVI